MAGRNPGFDPREFREGIHFAMQMGAPPLEENQAVFRFPSTLVYNAAVDEGETPFDPDATVTRTEPTPVKVPCAIEYYDSTGQLLTMGIHQPSQVKVTLLDEDYAKVEGFDRVVIAGDTYFRRRTQPPSGLFDVGLFEIWCAAEQET